MSQEFHNRMTSMIETAVPAEHETAESLCLKLVLLEIKDIQSLHPDAHKKAMERLGEIAAFLIKEPVWYNQLRDHVKEALGIGSRQFKNMCEHGRSKLKADFPKQSGKNANNPVEEIFFDGSAYYRQEKDGWYYMMSRIDAELHLRMAGVPCEKADGQTVSGVEVELYNIQRNCRITYAGPLCGRRAGLYTENGHLLLVTCSPAFIEAGDGDASLLIDFFYNLFGRSAGDPLFSKQFLIFCLWIKQVRNALKKTDIHLPGQMLALIGPVNCGKSLGQEIITLLLGGRSADPSLWLQGRSSFNGEMWGAEHLVLSDSNLEDSPKAKKELRDRLKELVANSQYSCHRKFKDELTLRPIWRISLSANDDPDSIPILPSLDESMKDKIIYLKVYSPPVPFPTDNPEARDTFYKGLVACIPPFVGIIDKLECPPELISGRFGVKEFHHHEIVKLLDSQNPDCEVSEILENWIGRWPAGENERTLSAGELYSTLGACSGIFTKVSSNPKHLGHQLKRLSSRPEWAGRLSHVGRRIGPANSEQYAWKITKTPAPVVESTPNPAALMFGGHWL